MCIHEADVGAVFPLGTGGWHDAKNLNENHNPLRGVLKVKGESGGILKRIKAN